MFPLYKIFILSIVFSGFTLKSQNLVPNAGFDVYTNCVTTSSQYNLTPPWEIPFNQTGSPDYLNGCYAGNEKDGKSVPQNFYGYQEAMSGKGYFGLITYYNNQEVREYIGAPLDKKLESGKTYLIGFYVSRAETFSIATDHFGIYLSENKLTGGGGMLTLDNYKPQVDNPSGNMLTDSKNWTLISGRYTADGNEKYVTVGNFYNDNNTKVEYVNDDKSFGHAFYFLEDVFVIPIEDSTSFMTRKDISDISGDIIIESYSIPSLTAATNEMHGKTYIDLPDQIVKITITIDGGFKSLEIKANQEITFSGIYIHDDSGHIVAQELPGEKMKRHRFYIMNLKNGSYSIEIIALERRFKAIQFKIDR